MLSHKSFQNWNLQRVILDVFMQYMIENRDFLGTCREYGFPQSDLTFWIFMSSVGRATGGGDAESQKFPKLEPAESHFGRFHAVYDRKP